MDLPEIPKIPIVNNISEKEKEKIEKLNIEIRERKEKEIAKETKKEINTNRILMRNGIKAYGYMFRMILIFFAILGIISVIVFSSFFTWAVYTNHLSGIVQSTVNNTIFNDYTFNPTTNNQYSNSFSNSVNQNNSYNFVFTDTFLTKFCKLCNGTI